MPTYRYPIAADSYCQWIVQPKCIYRCATTSRFADYDATVLVPLEVDRPLILAWVEQSNNDTCLWINTFCLRPFVLIAQFTGKTEILEIITSTLRHWMNVINLKPPHDKILMAEAVLTSISGSFTYSAPQILG